MKDLESKHLFVNTYDPCVLNLTVNRIQMTTTLHFKDIKISRIDTNELKNNRVDELNLWIGYESFVGKEALLSGNIY